MDFGVSNVGRGRRSTQKKSAFRQDSIKFYDSAYVGDARFLQGREKPMIWCPVTSIWVEDQDATAGHLFPYAPGQAHMDLIWGEQEHPELFSPRNCIVWHRRLESCTEDGDVIIIPDIKPGDEAPTYEEMLLWLQSDCREYRVKVRFLEANKRRISRTYFIGRDDQGRLKEVLLADLDGKKLDFRNENRPRARYVWFAYMSAMLTYRWSLGAVEQNKDIVANRELHYWGTPLPRELASPALLLPLIHKLGHEYDCMVDPVVAASIPEEEQDHAVLIQYCTVEVEELS